VLNLKPWKMVIGGVLALANAEFELDDLEMAIPGWCCSSFRLRKCTSKQVLLIISLIQHKLLWRNQHNSCSAAQFQLPDSNTAQFDACISVAVRPLP